MAEYPINIKLDPTGVVQGRQVVENELRKVETAGNAAAGAVSGAFGGGSVTAAAREVAAGATSVATAANTMAGSLTAAETATKSLTTAAEADRAAQVALAGSVTATGSAIKAATAETDALAAASKRSSKAHNDDAAATGNASASKAILQHVVRSTTDSFAAGLPVGIIFGEQIGRLAEAAEFAGGSLGKVGAFLAGPWGSR